MARAVDELAGRKKARSLIQVSCEKEVECQYGSREVVEVRRGARQSQW